MGYLRALLLLTVCATCWSADSSFPYSASELSTIHGYFKKNINYKGGGAVIASPSTNEPNYLYHWVRDGALSMHALSHVTSDTEYAGYMSSYLSWVNKAQNQADPNSINILGEPKYFVTGSEYGKVFNKPWGRPQNDSPALRALTLIYWASNLISNGNTTFVTSHLWKPNTMPPTCGPIKTDLEYISHHWKDSSFDPWEEANGHHFFTKMVIRGALLHGAHLGNMIGDTGAASFYLKTAHSMDSSIEQHWDPSTGVIRASLGGTGPVKYEDQDIQVILGSLYGYANDSFYGPMSTELWSSLANLAQVFHNSFYINYQDTSKGVPGLLYGRYPNDTYKGYGSRGKGNPWHLCTHAAAQFVYRDALHIVSTHALPTSQLVTLYKRIVPTKYWPGLSSKTPSEIAEALVATADGIVQRVKYHVTGASFHMNEELNRQTGFEQGAKDLTWSYATLIDCYKIRQEIGLFL